MFERKKLLLISIVLGFFLLANSLPVYTWSVFAYDNVDNDNGNPVVVNPTTHYQLQGWGTSLAWWANAVGGWSEPDRKALSDLVFGPPPNGLGFTIARYNLGAGDSAAGCPSIKPEWKKIPTLEPKSDGQLDPNADAGQIQMLLDAKISGANTFEAFSNSPPAWMTSSGCSSGPKPVQSCWFWFINCHEQKASQQDNLPAENYDKYADYLTKVVQYFHGNPKITFTTLEPFNESNSITWGCVHDQPSCQEGANFSPSTQNTIIHRVCDSLNLKGLAYTHVSTPDENSIDATIDTYNKYDSQAKSCISQINTHGYMGTQPYTGTRRGELGTLAQKSSKNLWMSEFGTGGDPTTMGPALTLSSQILKDMQQMHPTAWVYWQAVEDSSTNSGGWGLIRIPFNAKGLTQCDPNNQTTNPCTKQYYAMGNYSEFIKPGYQIIGINDSNSLAAYDPSSKTLVIVTTNNTSGDRTVTYDLRKFTGVNGRVTIHRTSATENLQDVSSSSSINISNSIFTSIAKTNSISTYVISGVSAPPSASTNEAGHVLVATSTAEILDSAGRSVSTRCDGQHDSNGAVLPKNKNVVVVDDTTSYILNGHTYVHVAYPDPCEHGIDYSNNQAIADGSGAVGWVALDALTETNAARPNAHPQSGSADWRDCWGPDQCGDASYPNNTDTLWSKDGSVLYAWWTGSFWDAHWWHVWDQNRNEAAVYGRDWSANTNSFSIPSGTITNEAGHVLATTSTTTLLDGYGHAVQARCNGQRDSRGPVLPQNEDVVVVNDHASYMLNGHTYVRISYPDPCENGMDYSNNQSIADGSGAVGWVALDALTETSAAQPKPQSSSVDWRDCWGPDQCGDEPYSNKTDILSSKDGPILYAWWTGSFWDVHWWHVRDQNGNEAAVYGRDWAAINK